MYPFLVPPPGAQKVRREAPQTPPRPTGMGPLLVPLPIASWRSCLALGVVNSHLDGDLGNLGPSVSHLDSISTPLGPSWAELGPILVRLGHSLGSSGAQVAFMPPP